MYGHWTAFKFCMETCMDEPTKQNSSFGHWEGQKNPNIENYYRFRFFLILRFSLVYGLFFFLFFFMFDQANLVRSSLLPFM